MPLLRQILCSLVVLVMVSAQNTPTIDADSTSTAQTAYTFSGTSIAAATGSPPPVASTTIHVSPTALTSSIPSSSSSAAPAAASTSSAISSVPVIAGIAAGGTFIFIATIIFITFLCIRSRRQGADKWPELGEETSYRSATSHPSFRRPSSAATLVAVPAQAYVHSKSSMEQHYSSGAALLHHSKSNKSSHSTSLERVSEEAAKDFKFDFGVPPQVEITPPPPTPPASEMRVHEDTLQKLCSDKSLPSSPEHEIPPSVLDLDRYRARPGLEVDATGDRRTSSIYSTGTGTGTNGGRDDWPGALERQSQSYF